MSFLYVRPNKNWKARHKRLFYKRFNKGLIPGNFEDCPCITMSPSKLKQVFKFFEFIPKYVASQKEKGLISS